MASKAGDSKFYVLPHPKTGVKTKLVRVTHVINCLSKPMLYEWYYRQTRDAIAGLVDLLAADHPGNYDDIIDMVRDGDMLEEYLKENRLRPRDVVKDRAIEGSDRHELFQRINETAMRSIEDADILAKEFWKSQDPFEHAISDAWLTLAPRYVEAAEIQLPNWRYGYCGTCDAVWPQGPVDLKTRKEGGEAYESDHVQTGAYLLSYRETATRPLNDDDRYILIVRDDGTWDLYRSETDPTAFLDLLSLYNKLRAGEEVS